MFYAVFTFVSDVSTFLLVKSGKTALHGRFRSRPSPHPFVPDLDLRLTLPPSSVLSLRLPLAQAPPPSFLSLPRRRRLLPVASFGPSSPGRGEGRSRSPRGTPSRAGAEQSRRQGLRLRAPTGSRTGGVAAAAGSHPEPAKGAHPGANCRKPRRPAPAPAPPLRYRYAPSRPSLMCPTCADLFLIKDAEFLALVLSKLGLSSDGSSSLTFCMILLKFDIMF